MKVLKNIKTTSLAAATATFALSSPAVAADGYWLDQYNALFYLSTFQLDRELAEMRRNGASVLMVHADSLPNPVLRWIAWRARQAKLQPVAWIQRPTDSNLRRVGSVSGYEALQVDDHFFANPPISMKRLKNQLADRQLWCSFQPRQFSWQAAKACDHIDLQIYRKNCKATTSDVYKLGVAGASDVAIAVYDDGSQGSAEQLRCLKPRLEDAGNRMFVFKWKNPEHWILPISRKFWSEVARVRSWLKG